MRSERPRGPYRTPGGVPRVRKANRPNRGSPGRLGSGVLCRLLPPVGCSVLVGSLPAGRCSSGRSFASVVPSSDALIRDSYQVVGVTVATPSHPDQSLQHAPRGHGLAMSRFSVAVNRHTSSRGDAGPGNRTRHTSPGPGRTGAGRVSIVLRFWRDEQAGCKGLEFVIFPRGCWRG